MDLGSKLVIVFVVFIAIIGVVMATSFRERKLANQNQVPNQASDEASDARTMIIIFGSIVCGMFLAILVAWLVFFS
jgi:ABC-type Fe3+ transport system permease subunit